MHIKFMMALYEEQARNGRHFLHEHPTIATPWALEEVVRIIGLPGVYVAHVSQCRFGLESADELGAGLVKKPT